MRFLGLGQLWNTGLRLVSVMFLCQLLSPLVALLAIVVSGSEMAGEAEAHTGAPIPSSSVIAEPSDVTEATEVSECCDLSRQTAPCPSDHVTSPSLCQDPEVACSKLPLQCVRCECDYNCSYGKLSQASCSADPAVLCSGDRNFTRQFTCSYCFLSDEKFHKCSNRDIGRFCRSTALHCQIPILDMFRVSQCRVSKQQVPLVHRQLQPGGGHHLPGQGRVLQAAGGRLDRGLQLEHGAAALRHPGRLRGGSVLPGPLAGGHRQAVQLRGDRGVDPGGRGAGGHWVYRTRGRVALYLVKA